MSTTLVLGGTGFVGRAVCAALAQRSASDRIVVPTRRLPHGHTLRSLPTVDLLAADVHDDAQLAALVSGSDTVVNLIAILHGQASDFDRVHVALPRRLAAACAAAGVRRVVHISALGAGDDSGPPPSSYLRSKTEGEKAIRAAGLEVTVLRPSVIFGADDRLLNLFATLQTFAPFVPLAASDARFQPVWVEDVARAVLSCLADAGTAGRIYECVGPRTYTLSELVRLAGRWSGNERAQFALPEALGRLQARLMELLPGEPLMSRDNLDSMERPNVASGTLPGLADLGIEAAALETVAPQYLAARAERSRLDRWRSAAGRD